jgi:pimeloyl-ACP methyl ester carboxylesterase
MAIVNVNGTALEYSVYGGGEPLVLVHGSASDHRTWQRQYEELAERYRVIVYSRRYHWPNEQIHGQADYAMAEQVDDLQALLYELDATPAHLVGHSYGAFLCLLLAIREPQLARTMVLTEPPVVTLFVSNAPRPLEILKLLATRPRTAMAIVDFGATAVAPATAAARRGDARGASRRFGRAILGRRFFARLSERRLEQVDANSFAAEFLGSGFAPLTADDVRGVHVPTLLVNGRHSHRVFHRLTDRLEELLPRAERIEIAGSSHIVHEDDPQAFNRAVQSFLEKHRRTS